MLQRFPAIRRIFSSFGLQCDDEGNRAFHCLYDREADLLTARFGSPEDADVVVVEPDVSVRISRMTNQPVAIEVIDCAARSHKDPSAITPAFGRELLARYGRIALARRAEAGLRRRALV